MPSSSESADPARRPMRLFNRPGRAVVGWYWLLPSRRLKRGRVRSLEVMGRELVAYRTNGGQAVVMDAYCPHMGCHFSLGKVEDDCLRCFFHGWAWDPNGACVDVPSLEGAPPRVRVQTWPSQETHGLLWVWIGDGEPDHLVPEPDDLAGTAYVHALGKSFAKRCHPNVVMINAIDEQHFRTVHHIPGHLMHMEPSEDTPYRISFANTAPPPDANALLRWISRFYKGPIRYKLAYWYGSNGIVTLGPDFLPLYILFALRQTAEGGTEGQTVVFTQRRRGFFGWLVERLVLGLTRIAGNYFSVGDTKVFQSIRFDYRTPVPADQAVQAFIRHLETQTISDWTDHTADGQRDQVTSATSPSPHPLETRLRNDV